MEFSGEELWEQPALTNDEGRWAATERHKNVSFGAEVRPKFGNRISDRSSRSRPTVFIYVWKLGVCCDDD